MLHFSWVLVVFLGCGFEDIGDVSVGGCLVGFGFVTGDYEGILGSFLKVYRVKYFLHVVAVFSFLT